jgi:uncharacterized protein YjbI with pentapeptide repeats
MKSTVVSLPQIPKELRLITDLKDMLLADETIATVMCRSEDITGVSAYSATIRESVFEKLSAAGVELEKLSLMHIVVDHGDLTAANCEGSAWQTVHFIDSRCSGLKLQTSILKDVTFTHCKLDLVNFRYTKLKRVRFVNCILDEADFYMAELDHVYFESCSLQKTEFSSAKCKDVDLRTSDLTAVSGISGIKGATINSMQLIELGPLLAKNIGISVQD